MAGIDMQAVLAAGAYGSGLLFFAYSAYVLPKARSQEQGRNVRWYMGIGAVVLLALVGLDLTKLLYKPEVVKPKVFLEFVPTFSIANLPPPIVRYRGTEQPFGSAIVLDDDATISISVEKAIEAVKQLRENNNNLKVAYGSALLSAQPTDFADRVAAIEKPDQCTSDAALCGWAQLSMGQLREAEESFEKTISTASQATALDRAKALQGLGEIYAGEGRIEEAKRALGRAADLGNVAADKRLQVLDASVSAAHR